MGDQREWSQRERQGKRPGTETRIPPRLGALRPLSQFALTVAPGFEESERSRPTGLQGDIGKVINSEADGPGMQGGGLHEIRRRGIDVLASAATFCAIGQARKEGFQ